MSLELWVSFTVATAIILVIPGPTIILVVSQAANHGLRSVAPLVAGVFLGDFMAMTLSLLGLGAIMAASATLFTCLKWIGALYLFYLGIKMWRSTPVESERPEHGGRETARTLAWRSFIVTVLNPKSIAFFVAFLPQFVDPSKPAFSQLVILGSTFLIGAMLAAGMYALFAGKIGDYMKQVRVRKWFERGGGTALIGAGLLTATLRRTT